MPEKPARGRPRSVGGKRDLPGEPGHSGPMRRLAPAGAGCRHNTRMPQFRPPCALTIAGSDSGGGAGIQADLKTFAAHGVHGLSAIAALTAQHTRGVSAVHVPPPEFLRAQIDACFGDFAVGAVKIGMLANAAAIHAVADALALHAPPWIVLDPVMIATSGARLLEDAALDALRTRLLPMASLVTPNLPEAELLLGHAIAGADEADTACIEFLERLGARAVLLKGGHLQPEGSDAPVEDRYRDRERSLCFAHARLPLVAHGTGCTLSSAIAANLCRGLPLAEACARAADYVHAGLRSGYRPGRGDVVVLDHLGPGFRRRD